MKNCILTIDIGNSTIVMGCIDDDGILFEEQFATRYDKTKIEQAMLIKSMLEINHIDIKNIEGVIISSVVPAITNVLKSVAALVTDKEPLIVGPGVKTGIAIKMDDPRTVGSDLIVAAVAVSYCYAKPAIIVDVGTATTITIIDETGAYIGGIIMPGVQISQEALISKTAQLSQISLEAPKRLIGKNTIDSLKSGAIYGTASCIDGMIRRVKTELNFNDDIMIVATGGLSSIIIPYCLENIIHDKSLLLKGLKIIYDINK